MQLVFAGSEIDWGQIFRGNLAIDSHRESGDDDWALALALHDRESAQLSTSNV